MHFSIVSAPGHFCIAALYKFSMYRIVLQSQQNAPSSAAVRPPPAMPGLPLMFNPSQFSQPPVLQQPTMSTGLHYGRRQYPRK